ncbi:MAG: hypothetical protein EBS19_06305 [Spirochaetia bacterium]|nr:hypothetical protein [Spirochaetia bacterium]
MISENALKLIIDFEVGGGEAYYNKKAKFPIWPGGASGITIGIGVDLGHIKKSDFDSIIAEYYSENESILLSKCIGFTGKVGSLDSEKQMKSLLETVKTCELDFQSAIEIHENFTIPLYYERTKKTFKGLDSLPDDAKGAIVSLVFNRGTKLDGPKRIHMAKIAELVFNYDKTKDATLLSEIADTFINMAEIWKGEKIYEGIKKRRIAEANLVTNSMPS